MPVPKNADTSDYEKLMSALSSVTSVSSLDDLLATFGLVHMPTAQRYGIMFGIVTFTLTLLAVITLLIMGGTFKRIAEQTESGEATVPDPITAREGRPLLLERLLEARDRMMRTNYPDDLSVKRTGNGGSSSSSSSSSGNEKSNDKSADYDGDDGPKKRGEDGKIREEFTILTKRLMNVAPSMTKIIADVPKLINDKVDKKDGETKDYRDNTDIKQEIRKSTPIGYEENYVVAYRKCQDKPGGKTLAGLPDARCEAYARAYAGCGISTTLAHRRSYARMYEAVSCKTHATEAKFREHYIARPQDLVGRTVRLEALEKERHLQAVYDATCGDAYLDDKPYDPKEVWGFLDCGPFCTPQEMGESFVFQRRPDEAAFAIVEHVTDRVIGVLILTNDDPKNLGVQLELPIVKPTSDGTPEQLEACFLLLDRLFALGYRRVQLAVDTQHAAGKKLPGRLGFTQEGIIPKHMIVKEANRDSNIYGLLNSDWDKGARSSLFKKLHGEKAQRADELNNAKEGELDEQQRVLREMRTKEEEAIKKKV